MSMFLTGEELVQLTGKKRRNAQTEALKMIGIEHIVRPDGAVVVSRAHAESMLAGGIQTGLESRREQPPNWGAMYNA